MMADEFGTTEELGEYITMDDQHLGRTQSEYYPADEFMTS